MKLVHKVMDFEVNRADEDNRTFWAVASSPTVDRQGDLVEPDGWDFANFLRNPVIPWAHDYASPPVARALAVKVENGRLLFKAQFPTAEEYAFADTIYRLYKGGYLRAFSVGFAPLESEVATHRVSGRALTGTRYLRQELYEISCVTLPANPEALVALGLPAASTPSPEQTPGAPPVAAMNPGAARAVVSAALGQAVVERLRFHLGLVD
ncbi:MAG: HK97 family phage prohead protease [Desulfarculaceae bacterium]|nr:HK97 family phage prohead protease [Desulfarculaceae bacterium]MCF8072579.1 HK97 family phage prohead protease [Desulfarculaceae bacterium]MCF8103482.1 HK97 family phage prohead protease [Desulfarculaceae bacterium]MCF8117500.1 HK97 family phage prohead protease [Desulfarculaceae bacterium]